MTGWFESLFGFTEDSYPDTRSRFSVNGTTLTSLVNGRKFEFGTFDTPMLHELRVETQGMRPGRLRVTHEVVDDVLRLHALPENSGALFQVASQFNCLEFAGPDMTPEHGVTGYANDATQGPACALAAAAATVYRNYFAPVHGGTGQTAERQLNNLDALEARLAMGNGESGFFEVVNGYTASTEGRLLALQRALREHDRESLLGSMKIGLQRGIDVTFAERFVEPTTKARVSQAFCSAISCGYTKLAPELWEPLATLVLDAAYEATLLSAVLDAETSSGSGKVWLTFLGGGVFGNRPHWITNAIRRALARCSNMNLDVRIAHYQQLNPSMLAEIAAL